MRKNLIFLTLLISVLMVSFVSAGITGYLVSRGGGIADSGYRATLQKVEGTTAIISVATPSGTTELVRVAEGEIAKVGSAEISASSLTRGTLFTRSGANVEIDVPEDGEEVPEPKGCEKVTLQEGDLFGEEYKWEPIFETDSGEVTGILIHFGGELGDIKIIFGETTFVGENSITLLEIGNFETGENWVILSVCPKKPTEIGAHTHLSDYRHGTGKLFMAGTGLVQGIISCKTEFGNDYVVLGGGFQLTDALETGMIINGPDIDERYRVSLNVNATNNNFSNYGKIYATCARIEPTLHQFGQDY